MTGSCWPCSGVCGGTVDDCWAAGNPQRNVTKTVRFMLLLLGSKVLRLPSEQFEHVGNQFNDSIQGLDCTFRRPREVDDQFLSPSPRQGPGEHRQGSEFTAF